MAKVNKTANLPAPATPAADIAESIAKQLAKVAPQAQVSINPHVSIPHNIGNNILEFLRRVKCEGLEAVGWVEAYQFVQQHTAQTQQGPGVPFTGLPGKQA